MLDQVAKGERLWEETECLMEEKQHLTSLYEQLLRDTQDEQSRMSQLREQVEEQTRRFRDLERELACGKDGAKLECLRAVEEEKKKWEKREARLVAQLGGGQERTAGEESRPSNLPEHTVERTAGEES